MDDYGDKDPLIRDDNDDEEGDTSRPSQHGPSGEEIPMTTMNRPPEHSSHTAETFFIEGAPRGRIWGTNSLRIELANQTLMQKYPEHGKDGKFLTLKVSEKTGKVVVVGPRGGETQLFEGDNQTLNSKISKTDMKTFGPEREELIAEKEKEIEELQKSIREDEIIANNDNQDSAVRERAREKITEKREQIDALENEREGLEEGTPLRERVKNIFKKYGFTVTAVVLAVGTVIGVIDNSLTKGLKSVAKGVGNGLKTLRKKIAQILPGLIGTIVCFIFKTAGSVIGFLGKNAWLLILGVAVFMVERFQKSNK